MSDLPIVDERLLEESVEDLYENAPCGYLSTDPQGTIVKVNQTFAEWTGYARDALVGRRLTDLLTAAGRIYHETHYAPLLRMQGAVREIAIEIVRADGSQLPVLLNSVLVVDEANRPQVIRTTIFDATDRRLYERELLEAQRREQSIAQELQRSLLSGAPGSTEELEIGVAYRPSGAGLEVGGDWYDSIPVESTDAVALVVGDVVGRGIHAAATMGQLRSAIRALASTGLGPAELIEALDRYARRHDTGTGSTLVYSHLHPAKRVLRWARAGHLPPLVARPGQRPEYLWDGLSAPLDAHVEADVTRAEAAIDIEPGSIVLLYTDGLVERRGEVLDDGLERLADAVERHADKPAKELADAIVRSLPDPAHSDDVCVLVAKLQGDIGP